MDEPPDGTRVFNEVAELYDTYRPGYPDALIEDTIALSHLPAGGRILEIGCGPGKATLPFAERGYAMLCLDPGPELIARAQEKVRAYPQVQFLVTRFEDWPLERAAFNLVIAASAFHWVDPAVGFPKIVAALEDTGAFATFRNARILDDSTLSQEIQQAYADHAPEHPGPQVSRTPPDPRDDPNRQELELTGLFREVTSRFYPWRRDLTTEAYLHLLDTYSGHRLLPEAQRAALYVAIRQVINQHGGAVTVQYVSTLYLARK